MEKTAVTLVPLAADDREQFILDNQWAFKHGALIEFGERDNHLNFDGIYNPKSNRYYPDTRVEGWQSGLMQRS